jgi:hypothetical protein
MKPDLLKAMLTDSEPPAPPARDLSFVVAVMKRVEQRRLIDGLIWLATGTIALTALLFLIMPYLTPALTTVGQTLWPQVLAAAAVLVSLYGLDQTRRAFGWRF